jgi:hypothetical protein
VWNAQVGMVSIAVFAAVAGETIFSQVGWALTTASPRKITISTFQQKYFEQ